MKFKKKKERKKNKTIKIESRVVVSRDLGSSSELGDRIECKAGQRKICSDRNIIYHGYAVVT